MPEIEITDDQREYLEDLRAELEEDVVYGHVRLTDALQFLIDSREEELTADEEAVGSASADAKVGDGVDSAASDGADAEAESNGEDGHDDEADDAEAVNAESADEAIDDAEDGGDDDADAGDDDGARDDDDADADKTNDGSESDADADEDGEPAAAPTPGGGGDRLNAMMQLLDTHDEKWREGSGDARYEVDLPDGSTETANTKDDVRALLFKNY